MPGTIPDLIHLLDCYVITVRYNVIGKKLEIRIPGASGCPDIADNSTLAQITSLATLNNIPTGPITACLEAIGDRNQYNPVAHWITSTPRGGKDRLQAIYETLEVREVYGKYERYHLTRSHPMK